MKLSTSIFLVGLAVQTSAQVSDTTGGHPETAFDRGTGSQVQNVDCPAGVRLPIALPGAFPCNQGGVSADPSQGTGGYIYSVKAGSSSSPISTYDHTGALLDQTPAGFDHRGLWYNPNTGKLEGNGFNVSGYHAHDLVNGLPIGTGTTSPVGQFQPNMQSMCDYDFQDNRVVCYDAGSVYAYNRADGALVSTTPLTGYAPGFSSVNENTMGYSGITDSEYALYNYVAKEVLFFSKATGAFTNTQRLCSDAPDRESFNMGFLFLPLDGSFNIALSDCTSMSIYWAAPGSFTPPTPAPPPSPPSSPAKQGMGMSMGKSSSAKSSKTPQSPMGMGMGMGDAKSGKRAMRQRRASQVKDSLHQLPSSSNGEISAIGGLAGVALVAIVIAAVVLRRGKTSVILNETSATARDTSRV